MDDAEVKELNCEIPTEDEALALIDKAAYPNRPEIYDGPYWDAGFFAKRWHVSEATAERRLNKASEVEDGDVVRVTIQNETGRQGRAWTFRAYYNDWKAQKEG